MTGDKTKQKYGQLRNITGGGWLNLKPNGRMVNETLRMGNVFRFEKLSYRALQKVFGRSVNTRAPGKFIQELARKAESAGAKVLEFPARLGLSSRYHCGVRK